MKKTKSSGPAITGAPPALQHELFEITDGKRHPEIRVYSNILELWDLLPKYDPYGSSKRYHEDLDISESIRKIPVRHKIHREQLISEDETFVDLELHITPARIETRKRIWVTENGKRKRVYARDENGDYIVSAAYVYPGLREDKVEEALKFLLSHGQGEFSTERTGVVFSIKQIQRELRRTGSSMSVDEIKESLEVLSRSRCEIYGLDADGKKRSVMGSSFLPNLIMVDRDTWEAQSKSKGGDAGITQCYAQFHIAVTMSIQSNQFRLTHYEKHQSLDNLLSRYIHKVLRTSFTNAGRNAEPFSLSYNTVMSEFGRDQNSRIDANVRMIETALKQMIRADIISNYSVEIIGSMMDKRSIEDRIYRLTPTQNFINEMIASNSQHKRNLELFSDFTNSKELSSKITGLDDPQRLVHKELIGWKISSSRALEIIQNYPLMLIRKILREVGTGFQSGKVKNPSGFILKALEEGWFADNEMVFASSDEPVETPNQEMLNSQPEKIQQKVLDYWDRWDKGMKGTFNKYGLNSPAVRQALGLEA
jgi:hypothetical protein